ncbi:class I SAM-dependent methyltransferase [Candidatus Atribacteria bacterium 1244-E10-H5-B2]|nr:MAG: class I SAM-dependent methyltransferase [Candidatus Atribacteria bacterium 1244-E10-H5-B2]
MLKQGKNENSKWWSTVKVKNFKPGPEFYDLQVDWDKRLKKEKDFFSGIFEKKKIESVLDVGCGTGHHAQLFSGYAKKVIAIDPSGETIDYAKKNVIKSPNVTLIKEGFAGLDKIPYGQFDLITSLGNTLPILGNRREVKQALKKIRKKLSGNGLAIVQFLNFNPGVLEKNRFYNPKVFKKDGKTCIFIKHFEYGKIKTRVDFIITVIYKNKAEDFFVNSYYLCTLKTNLFLKMAKNSGFKKIELLGPGGKGVFNGKRDISLYALLRM